MVIIIFYYWTNPSIMTQWLNVWWASNLIVSKPSCNPSCTRVEPGSENPWRCIRCISSWSYSIAENTTEIYQYYQIPQPRDVNERASRKACDPECSGHYHRAQSARYAFTCLVAADSHCARSCSLFRLLQRYFLASPNPRNATFERHYAREKKLS